MRKNFMKKISAAVLSMSMLVISAMSVSAAAEDCIDENAKASFKIHKYDMTAAREGGIVVETAGFANNGKADAAAEAALKNYAIQGVEFTYAKVGDIHTDSEGGRLRLLYDIPEALETVLMEGKTREDHRYTSTELNKALMQTLSDNTAGKDALEQFIENTSEKQALPLTDEQGATGASDLALGLYLVVETKVPANVHTTTDPFFVSLPMTDVEGDAWFYDVDVYPKNQTDYPDLDKLVKQHDDVEENAPYTDTATASEGDVVDYIFVSHLPNITSQATYLKQYTFVDRMDIGLTYNDDFSIHFYDSAEKAKWNQKDQAQLTWEKGSPNFTVEYGTATDESGAAQKPVKTAIIRMTEAGLAEINAGLSRMYMTVSYSCTVNSDAQVILGDEGNVNDVELTWNRTSDAFTKTIRDRAKVYSFGLNIQKNFEEQQSKTGNPRNVQFVLQNQTDGHYVTAVEGTEGIYYVTDGTKAKSEDQAAVFVPAQNGRLLINGLEADTYVLTEIATDYGYSLLREPMIIEINGTEDELIPSKSALYDSTAAENPLLDEEGERANASVDQKVTHMSEDQREHVTSENARVDLTILNSRSFGIPKTGDSGILFFPLAGCAAALAAVLMLINRIGKK